MDSRDPLNGFFGPWNNRHHHLVPSIDCGALYSFECGLSYGVASAIVDDPPNDPVPDYVDVQSIGIESSGSRMDSANYFVNVVVCAHCDCRPVNRSPRHCDYWLVIRICDEVPFV